MGIQKHMKVFTVLSFLRLRSADIFWYQWVYPTIIFTVITGGLWLIDDGVFTFDGSKFINDINTLMGILMGFYIAALAAVSSFTNENLDQIMKGRAPTLTSSRKGGIKETLTRRRFLAVIFGYCASLSIFLYIFGVLAVHINFLPPAEPWLMKAVELAQKGAWVFYMWGLSSLLVVTLLSLHYLVERMHRA